MNNEIWKDIEGYVGIYQVSNLGRVKSLDRWRRSRGTSRAFNKGKLLKAYKSKHGYMRIALMKNGNPKKYFIHRLIAQAFILNYDSKPFINHKNTIKDDNRLENLEWITASGNIQHAYTKGLMDDHNGEGNPAAKLDDMQVLTIKTLLNIGIPQKTIAKYYNVTRPSISNISRGHTWKHI